VLSLVGLGVTGFGFSLVGRADVAPRLTAGSFLDDIHAVPETEEDAGVSALTDRGTPIRLMRACAPRLTEEIQAFEREALAAMRRSGKVIRREPADDRSNCIGWVFTGGRYWMGDDQVDTILDENGYQKVSTAAVGDLVIYRDSADMACHVAVVRALCDDGTVLVEGKWGWMGTFLHRTEDSPYTDNFAYYRSPRAGHLLRGLSAAETRAE
jgi:hypothetical protein